MHKKTKSSDGECGGGGHSLWGGRRQEDKEGADAEHCG